MNRKKILHIIEVLEIAGAEMVVANLMRHMPYETWESEVCVLNSPGILGRELEKAGYPVHPLYWRKNKRSEISVVLEIREIIRSRRIDLIHAHNFASWYFCCWAALFSSVKCCVTLHGFLQGLERFDRRLIYEILSRLTSRIVLVTAEMKTQIESLPFFDLKKMITIVNGIDIRSPGEGYDREDKRRLLGLDPRDFVLGTVCRLYPEKNIEAQIKAVHSLRDKIPYIKLLIAAEKFPYIKQLEELVRRLGVEDRVHFLGLRRDIPELLRTFDLFLMTSFTEGTSLAILEAMVAGLPVIVSDVGGNRVLVTHGVNGVRFDLSDPESLPRAILDLYGDEKKRLRLGQRAERVRDMYGIEGMIRRYDRMYKDILSVHP